MPFILNAFQKARLISAVRSFNRAITMKAKEYAANGLDILIAGLPEKLSTAEVEARIKSKNDFRRIVGYANDKKHGRPSELDRVLKSVDPNALDVTLDVETGVIESKFERDKYKRDMRAVRREMKKQMDDIAVNLGLDSFDELEPWTKSQILDSNLAGSLQKGVSDDSVIDVDEATLSEWKKEDAESYRDTATVTSMYDVWMGTWTNPINSHSDMPGYQSVIDAMSYLYEFAPSRLNYMFASGRDEMDPDYISISGGESNPYVNIDYETRHNNVVSYILGEAMKEGY